MNSIELITKLNQKFSLVSSNTVNSFNCLRLQIMMNQFVNVRSNLVYISGPNMPQPKEFKEDCLYILYANQKDELPSSINTIYYTNPNVFREICETIHILLINDEEYKCKENEIHEIFRTTSNLITILKKCYHLLHNPILVSDAAFKCLGTWPNQPIGLRKFDQMLEHGFAQKDYLASAGEIIQVTAKYKLQGTFTVHFMYYDTLMTIAVTPIHYHGNVIGGLEIIEHDNPISETDIQLVNLLSLLLPLEMLQHLHHEIDYGNNFNQLFYDLVSLQPRNYEKMEKRIQEMPFLNHLYQIIHVEIPFEKNHMPHLFINELKETIPSSYVVLQEYSILLFVQPEKLNEEVISQLKAFSIEHSALICLSECYTNLLDTHNLVEQIKAMAIYLIQNGITTGIHYFKEYRFTTLLSMLPKKELMKQFIHPGVLRLARYDEEHRSNFLETTKKYLLYQSNAAECAKQMNLHRNSLIYRIEKASSIMEVSLDNPYDCFNLQTSIAIYETLRTKGD